MATIVSPYTSLVVDVLAVLVAGVVLAALVPGLPRPAAVSVAATVFVVVLAAQQLWGIAASADSARPSLETARGFAATEQCLVQREAYDLVTFTRWLARRMPPAATFSFHGNADQPCVQLALLPRRIVAPADRPQFTVYYAPGDAAVQARLREAADAGRIEVYGKGMALERNG